MEMKDLQTELHKHPELLTQLAALLKAQAAPAPSVTHRARRGKKKKSDRIGYLTAEELDALMRAVRAGGSVRDVAIFELAVGRGLRRGEVGLILMEHLRLNVKRAWIE